MLFHAFSSQEERRAFGGSYWIELQYCRLPQSAGLEQILSVDRIANWAEDSLYVHGDDDNLFLSQYGEILTDGVYPNGQRGIPDLCGINYYSQKQIDRIMTRIRERKPLDFQVLLRWLTNGTEYNGFYVLGL